MTVLLVAERDPNDRVLITAVLTSAGYSVLAPDPSDKLDVHALAVDAVVADLDTALWQRWLGATEVPGIALPLVLLSHVEVLLAPFAQRYECVQKPATPAAIQHAVAAALGAVSARATTRRFEQLPPDARARDEAFWAGRDRALVVSGVLRSPPRADLAHIAALIASSARVPMAMVTVLDGQRQHFLGQSGLPDDLREARGTPRTWSFCQHVVRSGATLIIDDARQHPALASSPLVATKLILAYAGVPVRVEGLGVIGTVCALSNAPHSFARAEIAALELAAALVEQRFAGIRRDGGTMELTADDIEPQESPEPLHPSPSLRVGDELDGTYLITAELGTGGMSEVFLARDKELGRLVAIKVLDAAIVSDSHLMNEARALAAIRHPSIVQTYGAGWCDGARKRRYMALEYIRGHSVDEALTEAAATGRPIAIREVARLVRSIAGALDTLHSHGITHGDVKPQNVLIDAALNRAVLIDFGIAVTALAPGVTTRTPVICGGTPGHSAPEQLVAGGVPAPAPAADVYALGALAYALLTGRGPYDHVGDDDRIAAQVKFPPLPASALRRGLPNGVDAVLARAMALDSAERHRSASELADALEAALEGAHPEDAWQLEPWSRGIAFDRIQRAVRALEGAAFDAAVLARLSAAERATWHAARELPALHPAMPLVSYLRHAAGGDPQWLLRVGEESARAALHDAVPLLEIERTPYTLLRAVRPLTQRTHNWARFEFEVVSTSAARVVLTMPPAFAPEACYTIAGTARALVVLAARSARVVHTTCAAAGHAACTFDVTW